jgi:integrase
VILRQQLAGAPQREQETKEDQVFEAFARTWFDDYVVSNNKYSEQRTKQYLLRAHLIPFFGRLRIREITSHHIEQFKSHQVKRGASNKAIKNQLTVLNKCLKTGYEWLNLQGAPPKIHWPKCSSYRTEYLSPDECELILTNAQGIVHEMILTALRTGMRQGEIRGLQWPSVDWQNQSVAVRHSRCDYSKALESTKNNCERHIPLDLDLLEALHRRKQTTGYVFTDAKGQPFEGDRLNRALTNVCKKAGLRRVTWHVLRHTFASHLAMRGVPLHIVQALMGHANVTTTMRYAHVSPSALRPAINMLNPKRMLNADFGHWMGTPWVKSGGEQLGQKTTAVEIGPKHSIN